MAKVESVVHTTAGVTDVDEAAGTVSVSLGEGDTIATLTVIDGDGNFVNVYLNWQQASMIMAGLGAAAHAM